VNFTALSRVLHRHRARSSPVNFTEFPRFHVPINNLAPSAQQEAIELLNFGHPTGNECDGHRVKYPD
jgi:hypothetical protein